MICPQKALAVLTLILLGLTLSAANNQRKRRQACTCKPLSACAGRFSSLRAFGRSECDLGGGKAGVCCSDLSKPGSAPIGISIRTDNILVKPSDIQDSQVREMLRGGGSKAPGREATSDKSLQAHRLFGASRKEDKDIVDAAYKLLGLQDLGISLRQAGFENEVEGLDSRNSQEVQEVCPWTGSRRPNCDYSGPETFKQEKYRTIDGSCNNKQQPLYGLHGTPLGRLAFPAYSDGHQPRLSARGGELPLARLITTNVFRKGDPPNQRDISELFIQFGQFLDHDLTHSPIAEERCCQDIRVNGRTRPWGFPAFPRSSECFPIMVPANDTFWGSKGRRCMEFTRNKIAPTLTCQAGAREQMNTLTHWIDLSSVYGSTETELRHLRDPSDLSLLAVSRSASGEVTPPACPLGRLRNEIEACGEVCLESQRKCVFAGDFRVNEQVGLTIEHTIWIREHNRIARELSRINSHWSKDRVFQEARRISIAEFQHIIYNEWAPLALGTEYMETINLFPLSEGSGYQQDYDANIDPRITNEFAGAAFRFGHSMVKSSLAQTNNLGRSLNSVDLRSTFNRPDLIQQAGFMEDTIRGATRSPAAGRDPSFADDIVNHLFQEDEEGGLDLMSFNIQRARERGIPGYNRFRDLCKSGRFQAARSIGDLVSDGYIKPDAVRRLEAIYDNVEDIDLFVGGILETEHRDSILGPTFKCIVGDQFTRLKRGDRFWYENPGQFTLRQLNELRKVSQARIMCDNFNLRQMQPMAFRTNRGINALADCSDTTIIPALDLEVFREA